MSFLFKKKHCKIESNTRNRFISPFIDYNKKII